MKVYDLKTFSHMMHLQKIAPTERSTIKHIKQTNVEKEILGFHSEWLVYLVAFYHFITQMEK